jgi:glucose/arabinose dehydrogenase
MSQRFRDVKSYILLSLTLAAGGAIAVACSSDDDPDTTENPLSGAAGTSGSVGSAGAGGAPAAAGAAGSGGAPAGAAGGNAAGSEGQPVDLPIDEPPAAQGGSGGEEPPPVEPPPPGATLAPNCAPAEGAVPNLGLELVTAGLTQPLYVTGVPGDDSRLIVVQKGGVLRVLVDGVLQEAPFLDVSDQVTTQLEMGALGLAFHPNYAENGLLYVHFSSNGGEGLPGANSTVVAEYQIDPTNRSVVNRASQRIVLTVEQPPAPNHKGGQLSFGPDGFLYLGLGDGGLSNDTGQGHAAIGNAQTLSTLLGKILRIDPAAGDGGAAHTVPAGNLADISGQQALPEIWAYGLRNPWRFSFDACTGDLYIGDVGQNALEEIDFVAAAPETKTIAAGLNFGWRIMEGTDCGPVAAECTPQTQAGLTLPVDTYGLNGGQSITGGYVYRGSAIPGLRGHYLYADYANKLVVRFRIENGQLADRVDITDQISAPQGNPEVQNISSFGQDNAGEVYVVEYSGGAIYRLVQAP